MLFPEPFCPVISTHSPVFISRETLLRIFLARFAAESESEFAFEGEGEEREEAGEESAEEETAEEETAEEETAEEIEGGAGGEASEAAEKIVFEKSESEKVRPFILTAISEPSELFAAAVFSAVVLDLFDFSVSDPALSDPALSDPALSDPEAMRTAVYSFLRIFSIFDSVFVLIFGSKPESAFESSSD